MIDFPANPTVGQQFTAAGAIWTWDGAKWTVVGLAGQPFLPLAGGTLTGPLTLASDPVGNLQSATKQYVDAQNAAQAPAMNDNRIINGDMRIDQRNNGASGIASSSYTVDRWMFSASVASKMVWGQNYGIAGPASSGFPYCLGAQSSGVYALLAGDYFTFVQLIEADMISDFAWGTPQAKPVTLSFWANCFGVTGQFSGTIRNAAGNRSYPFIFSLPTASTWVKFVINIPGDTTGTWPMSGNAMGMNVNFNLGCGATYSGPANAWAAANYLAANGSVQCTSNAAGGLWITGVKLEVGSIATPFNRQSLAKSLADCQRYYQINFSLFSGNVTSGSPYYTIINFPVQMRTTPTVTWTNNGTNLFPTTPATWAVQSNWVGETRTANGTGAGSFNSNVALNAEL